MPDLNLRLAEIERFHTVSADYLKTLALLDALKDGSVSLAQVQRTQGGWILQELPPPASPEEVARHLCERDSVLANGNNG